MCMKYVWRNILFLDHKLEGPSAKEKSKKSNSRSKYYSFSEKSKIKIKTRTFKWDPEAIELAIEFVNKEEVNVTDASKIFNIPCQTIESWEI